MLDAKESLLLGTTADQHTEIGIASPIDHQAMTVETAVEVGMEEGAGAGAEISAGNARHIMEDRQAGRSFWKD